MPIKINKIYKHAIGVGTCLRIVIANIDASIGSPNIAIPAITLVDVLMYNYMLHDQLEMGE